MMWNYNLFCETFVICQPVCARAPVFQLLSFNIIHVYRTRIYIIMRVYLRIIPSELTLILKRLHDTHFIIIIVNAAHLASLCFVRSSTAGVYLASLQQ